jgi:hypothetical protein
MSAHETAGAARREPLWQGLMARAVFLLDRKLQSQDGVFCYSTDPGCILRIAVTTVKSPTKLDWWTTLPAGARIVEIHFWNERVPSPAEHESAIAWALAFSRSLVHSLRLLSAYLAENPEFDNVRAIRGEMALGGQKTTHRLLSLTGRLGFKPCGERKGGAGLARRIGGNILISMLILARNANDFRLSGLSRTRVPIFMSREVLDAKYGAGNTRPGWAS